MATMIEGIKYLKSKDPHFRRTRQHVIIKRLKEKIREGQTNDRLKVAHVRQLFLGGKSLVSTKEFGHVLKIAFPAVKRRMIHSCWYYYGIQEIKSNCPLPSLSMVAKDVVQANQEEKKGNKFNAVDEPKKSIENSNGLYKIPYLNICYEDLVFSESNAIGSGTFGKCFSGKYKGLPVAVKVFKEQQHYSVVHKEAGILTKIPSHPNIAMLIGVYTFGNPFLLLTKLCSIEGIPKTYSVLLKEHENNNTLTTNLCIPILHEMSSAISHVHKQGILHNDIKCNLVIEATEKRKRPVLIDFGKATYVSRSKASVDKKSMNYNQREMYRKRYPHIAPEISIGKAPSITSDTYPFGFLFCTTMRVLDSLKKLGSQRCDLLKIGKSLTHYNPNKRSSLDKITWNIVNASNIQ